MGHQDESRMMEHVIQLTVKETSFLLPESFTCFFTYLSIVLVLGKVLVGVRNPPRRRAKNYANIIYYQASVVSA